MPGTNILQLLLCLMSKKLIIFRPIYIFYFYDELEIISLSALCVHVCRSVCLVCACDVCRSVCLVCACVSVGLPSVYMCVGQSASCVHVCWSVCLVCACVLVGLPCVCMCVGRSALCRVGMDFRQSNFQTVP